MNIFDKILTDQEHATGKIMDKPTLLSECETRVTIDEKEKYNIEIEQGDYLVVCVGFTSNKSAAKFTHPNIAATCKTIHEFKHYRKHGSKFWTSRAGINHYLVIPRNQVTLLPEKGFSYIRAEINGVKVTFNVSGGGSTGWTDYLTTYTSISVNHKLSDFKKICEVAIRNSPFEPITPKGIEDDQEKQWLELTAKSNPQIKEKIVKMIEEGKKPIVHLTCGYSFNGGQKSGEGTQATRRWKRFRVNDETKMEQIGAVKEIIIGEGWGSTRVKINQIDWHTTAMANNI